MKKGFILYSMHELETNTQPSCGKPSGLNVVVMRPGQSHGLQLYILIALLNLAVLLSLFILRSHDDNRLTSWSWVFADFSPLILFIILVVGMLIAYPLSRISLPERTSIFLLTISSFLISTIFWQQPEVIVDASRYFVLAKQVELHGPAYFLKEWGNAIPVWTDLPLIPFIYGVIFRVFGETRIGVQFFISLLFSGTVGLTYLLGKTLWNKHVGLYASALLLGIPYLYTQVPLFMVDVPAMFFLTLAVYAVIKAAESRQLLHCLLASVAITLALLSKYSNWLMLSVIPFVFLGYFQHSWKALARQGAITAAGVFVLMGIFLLSKYNVIIQQLQLLRTYQLPALGGWGESLFSTFFFQIHPFITIAAVFSLYRAVAEKELKYLIVGWLVVLILLLDVRRARYLIIIFPLVTLMSAYGLEVLKSAATRRFVASSAVVSAALIATFAYLPFLEGTSAINIKQAGEYLDSLADEKVELYVLSQSRSSIKPSVTVPILDLFTEQELTYHAEGNSSSVPSNVDILPLRWSWELSSTRYLDDGLDDVPGIRNDHGLIAVIQSEVNQPLPAHLAEKTSTYSLRKEFKLTDRAFNYQTLVTIYQRNGVNTGEESKEWQQ